MTAVASFPRVLEMRLRRAAKDFPVITLTGPRQSGKSTLCRRVFRGKEYANLEAPDVRQEAIGDARAFLRRFPRGAVLDEIQRAPEIVSYLQGIVDDDPSPGRWILTGSQHLAISQTISQSLAGRTAVLELLPLSYDEASRFPMHSDDLWLNILRGGNPALHARRLDVAEWMTTYVATYLERDVRDLRQVGDLTTFQTMLRLLAGRTGQLLNIASLGNDVGVAQGTMRGWISVLEATYVVVRTPPMLPTLRKRLVKTPKIHFVDSGLACWLLGIRTRDQLLSHPARGALFESWVHAEVLKSHRHRGTIQSISFYRDQNAVEVDLIVESGDSTFVIEVKSAATVASDWFAALTRAATTIAEGSGRRVVPVIVYAGERASEQQGVRVVPWNGVASLFRQK